VIGVAVLWATAMLQAVTPPARSIDRGVQSEVGAARQVTVRDPDGWTSLWRAHGSSRPLPAIDFSREMVVGVFLGSRPTAGFAVEIVGYREAGNDVVVQYRETTPARDAITAQVIVSPYHLVVIPKRTGNVTFEKVTT
jgi:protease stability complex PrcB-like protein